MTAVLDEQEQGLENFRRKRDGLIVAEEEAFGRVQPEGTKLVEVLSFRHDTTFKKSLRFLQLFPKTSQAA
jgi:hypothetical protein